MGFFDELFGNDRKQEQKKDSCFTFDWMKSEYKDPIRPKNHKPKYKNLESYSSDEEAEEDGFFDENPL